MKTEATHKFMHAPPKKVRRFAQLIKGEPVRKADAILQTKASTTCEKLRKLLKSAVANAEHNDGQNRDNLVVENVIANQGPRYKRIRPRARGRAYLERKRTTHATIVVENADTYKQRQIDKKQRKGMSQANKRRGRSPQHSGSERGSKSAEASGSGTSSETATATADSGNGEGGGEETSESD